MPGKPSENEASTGQQPRDTEKWVPFDMIETLNLAITEYFLKSSLNVSLNQVSICNHRSFDSYGEKLQAQADRRWSRGREGLTRGVHRGKGSRRSAHRRRTSGATPMGTHCLNFSLDVGDG